MQNIDKIQNVVNGIGTQSIDSTINNFSSALIGLESYTSDPAIHELINQIYTLLNILNALNN